MFSKILLSCLLSIPLIFCGLSVPIQETSLDSNNAVIKSSAISDDDLISETSADLLASDDKTLTDVNIVNYDLSSGATTFEYFDMYSYEAKNSNSINELSSNSSVNDVGGALDEVNVPDFEIHQVGDTDMYYVNGYTPLTASSEEIKDEEADDIDAIIGTDERTQVTNTKTGSYLKTAYMTYTYDNVYNEAENTYESVSNFSTAFMVGPNIVATAGHCLYQDVTDSGDYDDEIYNPRFPDKVEFYFGVNSLSEVNSSYEYYAEGEVVHIEYSYYISPSFDHDWAVVELDRDLGNTTGWFGRIANWYDTSAPVDTYGYPVDKPRATMWEITGNFYNKTDFRYYTNNIDTIGGQSGSPYVIAYSGVDGYVCGIHAFAESADIPTYNGGTVLYNLIFHYIRSFTTSYSQARQYEYPTLEVVSKTGSTWLIRVENTSSAGINLEYNSKMCFFNDAKNWTGLNDVVSKYFAPYEFKYVSISENVFATSITCSYVRGGERIITYANNLDTDGTLTSYNNVIPA
ncbi:MAG TPA: trypsin-like serine protease [Candidatus Coproplasma stercoripullorum]|uniref:Trypsin-like serine protease n=1 Tax=Candidatus Coproplasma stercoripullorum TaxID=2840751 RepID=A0A9D1DC61_9FIRM|nr:trypsin-like serine protease [Candidatus Coproplasma stercoripullorum]